MKPLQWARTRSFALAVALAFALAACGPRPPQPISAFEGRLGDWTRELLADSPELAALAGASAEAAGGPFADRLDDRSAAAVARRRSAALRRYAELGALDAHSLSDDERLTYSVLHHQFAAAAAAADFDYGDFSQLDGVKPYVLNQLDSAFVTLPEFFEQRHVIANAADAENYLARLRQAADAIDQETERARADAARGVRPPLAIIDATVQELQGRLDRPAIAQPYVVTLQQKLAQLAAAETDDAARAEIERRNLILVARAEAIVRDRVLPAHQRAANFLRAERANAGEEAGVSRLPRGAEFYAAALAWGTGTAHTPAQLERIGLARVAALEAELDNALRRLGLTAGTPGERLAQLTADPRHRYEDSDAGRAQLLADVQARVSRAMQRAPEWFGRMPRARLEVRRVPVLAEASAPGAYYSAPSLDGAAPGIYYINLGNLAGMTRIDLPTQDYHEAAPGHHFQVALAQEQPEAPLLRRLISFNAYGEGWGLYAEQLADEQGFYENDPVGRVGYLRWQLWRAVRLVVDTGLHARNWTRAQAIAYMMQKLGDDRDIVADEVDRYIVSPGQACGYEVGRQEISRLREMARNRLGRNFDLRGFHDAVLAHGELPLPVLEQQVRAWLPEREREAAREQRRRGR